MRSTSLYALGASLLAAALIACGSARPTAITPTLPGDGDSNIAQPSAKPGAKANDPWAGRTDLIKAPIASPPQPLDLPAIDRFTLPSGLPVLVLKSDRVPVVSMQLAVKAGRADEAHAEVGLADFAAEMLLKGVRGKDALTIARAIDRVGGQLTAGASHEATVVSCNVLARDLGTCMTLVPAAVSAPTFPADKLPEVRDALVNLIRRRIDDSNLLAATQVQNLLWGNEHPRGWTTTPDGIASIDREALVRWHKARFSPDNALLVVVGAVDAAKLKRDLTRAFAGWRPSKVAPRPSYPEPRLSGVKVRLVDRPKQAQTQVRVAQLGIRHDDPRFFESLVWNHALGSGAAGSRLNEALGVDAGKAFGASSTFDRNLDRGSFVAGTIVPSAAAVAAAETLIAEIARMHKGGPSEAEVAEAVATLAGGHALRFESAADIASSVLAAELHGFGEQYLENFAVRVGKVDVAAARQAAHEVLDPGNFVIVMVGDAKDLEPQLKRKGWRYEKVPFAAAVGGALPPAGPPPPDPKAEKAGRKVLDEALAAKGGAKVLQLKTVTLSAKGKLTAQGRSVDIDVTRRLALPERMRIDLELDGGAVKIAYAFDGKSGWQDTPQGLGDIPADQVPALVRQRWLDPELILLRHREKGAQVRALPDETIEGVTYHLVNVTSPDRKHTATLYIDARTKLVARLAYPEQGGVTVDTYGDYRAVSGIQVAHKRDSRNLVEGKAGGESASLEVTKVEINPAFNAAVFARPAGGGK